MSDPQILSPLPGDLPRLANEERVIAQQWEQYEAIGSPDTYDMVNGVVVYADEQMGREVMSPEQWFEVMCHVREQITPILTRRRGRRLRRRQQQHEQDQE